MKDMQRMTEENQSFQQTEGELRERLTEVAEIFEKKKINQMYSFEVLCDFIFDKAKRIMHKFESAQDNLKQERTNNAEIQNVLAGMNEVVQEFVPRLSEHVGIEVDTDTVEMDDVRVILERVDEYLFQVANQFQQMKRGEEKQVIKRELQTLMSEKHKLEERQCEMSGALKELADDLRHQKDENKQLRERLSTSYSKRPDECLKTTGCPKIDKLVKDYRKENTSYMRKVAYSRLQANESYMTEEEMVQAMDRSHTQESLLE